jgi:hypothetical protein
VKLLSLPLFSSLATTTALPEDQQSITSLIPNQVCVGFKISASARSSFPSAVPSIHAAIIA